MSFVTDWLHRAPTALFETLLPSRCAGCGGGGSLFCDDCQRRIVPLARPACPFCLAPTDDGLPCTECRAAPSSLWGLRAVGRHEDPLRQAIHRFKYDGWHTLAAPLAALLVPTLVDIPRPTRVIAVPSHPFRLSERGYDHAELLARQVAARLDIPLDTGTAFRIRATAHQARQTTPTERRTNVAGAFLAQPLPPGTTVLLVDDVYTTGSTMQECARALRQAGAATVWGVTLSRA